MIPNAAAATQMTAEVITALEQHTRRRLVVGLNHLIGSLVMGLAMSSPSYSGRSCSFFSKSVVPMAASLARASLSQRVRTLGATATPRA